MPELNLNYHMRTSLVRTHAKNDASDSKARIHVVLDIPHSYYNLKSMFCTDGAGIGGAI